MKVFDLYNFPSLWRTFSISFKARLLATNSLIFCLSKKVFISSLLFFKKFIYLWLCWVFVSVRGLSLVVASVGHSSSRCTGLSLSQPLLLRSTGSRHTGSVIVAHGPCCSTACGIFPDQGSNPCPLHWQADSQPLRHQGSPLLLKDNFTGDRIWRWWFLSPSTLNISPCYLLTCMVS